ncbi:hypothetical protein CLOM_g9747 [Closterium sp. NIES-68]|nr:hypothetical protein CLOM_g9747 [Closterium sp. NIES-68]GJP76751.1 hypothetical protein CLOP_g7214 [Closterium sp. NIES-67]
MSGMSRVFLCTVLCLLLPDCCHLLAARADSNASKAVQEFLPARPGSPPGKLHPTRIRGLRDDGADDEKHGDYSKAGRHVGGENHADEKAAGRRRVAREARGRRRGVADTIGASLGARLADLKPFRKAPVARQRAPAAAGAAELVSTAANGGPPFGISPHWCTDGRCGVLHKPIRVFVLWYGAFSDAQKRTVRSFVASLSPNAETAVTVSLWWNVNRLYHDEARRRVTDAVTWGGETDDAGYSRGTTLYDADVTALIADAITSGRLPYDGDAVYFVLSDASVEQAGSESPQADRFCVGFCGWHFFGSAPGLGTFITAWAGKADQQCPTACIAAGIRDNPAAAPTGDPGMDGLLSVFAHELAEAASSPFVSTWFDGGGEENADKCSWMFSPILTDPSGARYNLVGVNGSKFLIQQNWDLTSGACQLALPYPQLPSSPPPAAPRFLRPLPASPPPAALKQAAKGFASKMKALLKGRGRKERKRPPRPPVVRVQSTGKCT